MKMILAHWATDDERVADLQRLGRRLNAKGVPVEVARQAGGFSSALPTNGSWVIFLAIGKEFATLAGPWTPLPPDISAHILLASPDDQKFIPFAWRGYPTTALTDEAAFQRFAAHWANQVALQKFLPDPTPFHAPSAPRATPQVGLDLDRAPPVGISWENEYSVGALFHTIEQTLIKSAQFFRSAAPSFSIWPALLHLMVVTLVVGAVDNLISKSLLDGESVLASLPPEVRENPFIRNVLSPGSAVVLLTPLLLAAYVLIIAAIQHLVLMSIGGAGGGMDATVRVVAFTTSAVMPLQVVPILGSLVAMVWQIVTNIFGLREIHQTSTGKAAAAVLLPLVVACGGCVGLIAWAAKQFG